MRKNYHVEDFTMETTVAKLAERTGLHPTTIRRTLKSLEAKGAVVRLPSPRGSLRHRLGPMFTGATTEAS
jgi:DNA-binding MarR family transcriptional regulator